MKRRIFACMLACVFLTGGCGQPAGTPEESPAETAPEEALSTESGTEDPDAGNDDPAVQEEEPDLHEYDFTLAFAGDINLGDDWGTMDYYREQENGIRGCIDPQLIERMQTADLMCLNLECCLSDAGAPMEGKAYTFRG